MKDAAFIFIPELDTIISDGAGCSGAPLRKMKH
jgi:hypothetical protein